MTRRRPTSAAASGRGLSRKPGLTGHRSMLTIAAGLIALAGCADQSAGDDATLPALFGVDDFGAGWFAEDPGDVPLAPASVAPPCPFEMAIPDVEVTVADSMEFGNDQRRLGINHTVAELNGEADTAAAVLQTWATMDCSESDFDQASIDGLPAGMLGVELTARTGAFSQAVLIDVDGSTMSFLIVSGDGDEPVEIARDLADRL